MIDKMFSIFKKKPLQNKFMKEVERQIKSYGYDKDNWGMNAEKSVSLKTIELVESFFDYLSFECPAPYVYSDIGGSVRIHFAGYYNQLWLVFLPDYKIHYFYDIPNLGEKEETIKSNNRTAVLNLKIAMNFLFHNQFEAFV